MKQHRTLRDEYVGKRVKLLRDLTTVGGVKFKAGEVMDCYNIWHGHLNLSDAHNPPRCIHQVPRTDVVVVREKVTTLGKGRDRA